MEYTNRYQSPLGELVMTSDGCALTGLRFERQKGVADKFAPNNIAKNLPIFDLTVRWLDIYFSGQAPDWTPPLLLNTTPFRKQIWEILQTIPFGKTTTYGAIAAQFVEQSGIRKMSAQAVGSAVGHNPIALIIPCHRVIGANGNLVGYAAGIDKKIKLLELERVNVSGLSAPR